MAECYTATIKEMKKAARKKLNDCEHNYNSLTNQNTEFAKDCHAILTLLARIDDLCQDAPLERKL